MPEPHLGKRKYLLVPRRRRAPRPSLDRSVARSDPEQQTIDRFGKSRGEMIAEAAYFRSLRRGRAGCDPDRDWAEAEREIDALLAGMRGD